MAPQRFEAVVRTEGPGAFVEVPEEVIGALGAGKRPPVVVEINGFRYPSTPAVYGGRFYLGFRKEVRQAAGIEPGQTIAVSLELDETRRRKHVERTAGGILRPGPKDR